MEKQVNETCRISWYRLFQLSKIKRYLTISQLTSAVIAYVISKLDQNNSLLTGIPDYLLKKLQRVQNAAARIITGSSRYQDARLLLYRLHWLPISARIDFKVLLLTYKCFNEKGPVYLRDLLQPYA